MGKLNIRDHTNPLSFRVLWVQEQFQKLRNCKELEGISNEDLKKFLLEKYDKRQTLTGRLFNNTNSENKTLTLEQFINIYLNEPYILSGYSCFYKNQNDCVNISSEALKNLGEMRKVNKKKMEAAPYGSDDYVYYRILQLTYKLLMNSYYGILGEKNSIFYNPFVQNSITMSSQDLITTSIIAMEAFLSNNVLFETTDDVLEFINNVRLEKSELNILSYLDAPVSKERLLKYLLSHKKADSVLDERIIATSIENLSEEVISKCYYKNQIRVLIEENSYFQEKLRDLLKYKYLGSACDEMKPLLAAFKEKIIAFCFYDQLYEDRYKRAVKDKRRSVITIDTDSNFINANKLVEAFTAMFNLDPKDSEQQGSIVNIIIDITTAALEKTFWTLTTNMGLVEEAKPLINMKQEFLYSKLLLTNNKKNYAGIITAELGKTLERPVLDIKGLPILKKSSVPKALRKKFKDIVENDILKPEKINLKTIINRYDDVENSITASLKEGNVEYLLPKNLEVIEKYKLPEQIEAIRGSLIWNALEPENQIIPPEKVNLIKCNCTDENDPRLLALKESHPDKYAAIMKTVFNHGVTTPKIDISRFALTCIAIPKSVTNIPEYIRPFIDYSTMTNTNMQPSYILLESLGVYCETVKTVKYKSNIISI